VKISIAHPQEQRVRRSLTSASLRHPMRASIVMLMLFGLMTARKANAGDAQAGEKIFKEKCARCHGQTAKGDGPDLVKLQAAVSPDDWTDKETNKGFTDAFVISMITKGGKANGKSPIMPSFAGKLSDDQIQDLLAFLRSVAK
jgi:mono/diheme cytochrome c family protein